MFNPVFFQSKACQMKKDERSLYVWRVCVGGGELGIHPEAKGRQEKLRNYGFTQKMFAFFPYTKAPCNGSSTRDIFQQSSLPRARLIEVLKLFSRYVLL